MIYAIGFYWFCAGLASYRIDKAHGVYGVVSFVFSMIFGGVAIPTQILTKMAR
jgi:hypothetical protein